MSQLTPAFPGIVDSEISALIVILHETERRLEELTAGEVDSVADADGRTFLLREAQDRLRQREAIKQVAILNALPASIALLDRQGVVVSVNEAWGTFRGDVPHAPGCAVGRNYLHDCANDPEFDTVEGRRICDGIRSLLAGEAEEFSMEYSCGSAAGKRWFLVTATPLAGDPGNGVVVMHVDTTSERLVENELHFSELKFAESERRFSDMLDNVDLISIMIDRESRITYCNDYLLRLTGWQREDAIGRNFFSLLMPAELADVKGDLEEHLAKERNAWHYENEILTRTGERRFIHWNNAVLRSAEGDVIGTASIGEDITDRRIADDILRLRTIELERFHRLSVGRELQMIELKRQINDMATRSGHDPPYDLAFPGQAGPG